MKRTILILAALLCCILAYAEWDLDIDSASYASIHQLAQAVARGEKEWVAAHVAYPLYRSYPIPHVFSQEDFIARWDELVPEELQDSLRKESPADWHRVGWHGIMYRNGEIWVDYVLAGNDLSSQLGLTQINSTNAVTAALYDSLCRVERRLLSLEKYEVPRHCFLSADSSILVYVTQDSRRGDWDRNAYILRFYHYQFPLEQPFFCIRATRQDGGSCGDNYYEGRAGKKTISVWSADCGLREIRKSSYGCILNTNPIPLIPTYLHQVFPNR